MKGKQRRAMGMSAESRDRIVSECRRMLPRAEEAMLESEFTTRFTALPILINGVVHTVRYNVKEKRFDRLGIWTDAEGNVGGCDRMEVVDLERREDGKVNKGA